MGKNKVQWLCSSGADLCYLSKSLIEMNNIYPFFGIKMKEH